MVQSNLGREVGPKQRNSFQQCFCAEWNHTVLHSATRQSLETLLLTEECDIDYKTLMLRGGETGRQGGPADYGGQLLVKLAAVRQTAFFFAKRSYKSQHGFSILWHPRKTQKSMVSLQTCRSLAPQMHFKIHLQNCCFFFCWSYFTFRRSCTVAPWHPRHAKCLFYHNSLQSQR